MGESWAQDKYRFLLIKTEWEKKCRMHISWQGVHLNILPTYKYILTLFLLTTYEVAVAAPVGPAGLHIKQFERTRILRHFRGWPKIWNHQIKVSENALPKHLVLSSFQACHKLSINTWPKKRQVEATSPVQSRYFFFRCPWWYHGCIITKCPKYTRCHHACTWLQNAPIQDRGPKLRMNSLTEKEGLARLFSGWPEEPIVPDLPPASNLSVIRNSPIRGKKEKSWKNEKEVQ